MKQLQIGDVTIDAIIEREGPWRRPVDFFPAYDEHIFRQHLQTMESEFFDEASGLMPFTYQTFVVRTPRHAPEFTRCRAVSCISRATAEAAGDRRLAEME